MAAESFPSGNPAEGVVVAVAGQQPRRVPVAEEVAAAAAADAVAGAAAEGEPEAGRWPASSSLTDSGSGCWVEMASDDVRTAPAGSQAAGGSG